jgi:hypothetical protein
MDNKQILLQEFLRLCEPLGIEYIPSSAEMAFKYLLPAKHSPFNVALRVNLLYEAIDIWIVQGEETKALKGLYKWVWSRHDDFNIEEILLEINSDIVSNVSELNEKN